MTAISQILAIVLLVCAGWQMMRDKEWQFLAFLSLWNAAAAGWP